MDVLTDDILLTRSGLVTINNSAPCHIVSISSIHDLKLFASLQKNKNKTKQNKMTNIQLLKTKGFIYMLFQGIIKQWTKNKYYCPNLTKEQNIHLVPCTNCIKIIGTHPGESIGLECF